MAVDEDRSSAPSFTLRVCSWGWSLIPFASLGYLTPMVYLVGAVRRPGTTMWISTAGYAVLWILILALVPVHDADSVIVNVLIALQILLLMIGAGVQSIVLRRRVWYPSTPTATTTTDYPRNNRAPMPDATELLHRKRMERQQARRIVADDPILAKQCCIGRPDVDARTVSDGGLVDVNHAPAQVLREYPGLSAAVADSVRERVSTLGPFTNMGEMLMEIDVAPEYVNELSEYAVFLP
ncbi:hypothetical protein [Haloglycomyces albus]|uniref:hypothetical protein n=1 Tax=Haloglycomyces albus TaxID=526067 RepID=UPI00046D5E84|nr:hypothetical protein [Haloglycomyces albus]